MPLKGEAHGRCEVCVDIRETKREYAMRRALQRSEWRGGGSWGSGDKSEKLEWRTGASFAGMVGGSACELVVVLMLILARDSAAIC